MPTPIAQLKREALAGLTSLGEALDKLQREPLPGLEPDVEAMVTKPAATTVGSVNLLTAVQERAA